MELHQRQFYKIFQVTRSQVFLIHHLYFQAFQPQGCHMVTKWLWQLQPSYLIPGREKEQREGQNCPPANSDLGRPLPQKPHPAVSAYTPLVMGPSVSARESQKCSFSMRHVIATC